MAKSKTSSSKMQAEDSMQTSYSPEFKEFFVDGLKDIYWAEKHLTKALPKMQKAATSEELKAAFGEHLEVTKNQVMRLEQIFELLGLKAQAKKCDAMAGLVEEANGIIEETEKGTHIRDAGLIMAAQKVEHYEIATYGGLAQLAKTMGNEEIKNLLGQTLDEEKQADESLTGLAEGSINQSAATEGMEEQETEEPAEEYASVNLKTKTRKK
ncbi:MAG: ferritin-like domain-containing protein [Ferruginibacter sp.]|nr:ferritin-like domain-containing protein [Ferruginibacter sp.]